jgi:hypothetical protein
MFALCLVHAVCSPNLCAHRVSVDPGRKGRKGSVSAWFQWWDVVWVPGSSWGWLGPELTETSVWQTRLHGVTASSCLSRREVESQLRAKRMLAADRRVLCAQLWLGEKPHYGMHRMVWDMVCLAAIHAMNVGRQAAWSVSHRVASPDLVADVVRRIVKAAFWNVLADFAVSVVVPRSARNGLLTNQPFLVWPVVVVRGSGLRVVRY